MADQLRLPLVEPCRLKEARGATTRRRRGYQDPPASELTNTDLLIRLLGARNEVVCEQLTASYASFREIAAAHPEDLREHGLSTTALERLSLLAEFARRFAETELPIGEPFRGSYDVYAHFRERLAAESVERFYAVLLDNKNRKMKDVLVSLGSLTASIVHPRDVYARIIRDSAAAVVFVHNHPSGDPTPSKEDLEITRRLRDVGDLVGVRVLDHLIIGRGRYVSFVDDGYW